MRKFASDSIKILSAKRKVERSGSNDECEKIFEKVFQVLNIYDVIARVCDIASIGFSPTKQSKTSNVLQNRNFRLLRFARNDILKIQ